MKNPKKNLEKPKKLMEKVLNYKDIKSSKLAVFG